MKKAGIVTFAFGTPSDIRSNQLLAKITTAKARLLEIPVYTQLDIQPDPKIELDVSYTEGKPGEPPPTLRIAHGAVQWAIDREITELWIVCAKPHLRRSVRDLKYAVKESELDIQVRISQGIFMHPETDWFCPNSTQPRTRSIKDWRKREFILTHMPMFLYKRIAS